MESLITRRWAEIKFFKFCKGIYSINRSLIDVSDVVQVYARISGLKEAEIKTLAMEVLSEEHRYSSDTEAIFCGNAMGMSQTIIAETLGISRQTVYRKIKKGNNNIQSFSPRYPKETSLKLMKLLQTIEKIQKAGII